MWTLQDAPGPHAPLKGEAPAGFTSKDRIVATYYFYWYDAGTKEHVVDADGSDALQDHPPTLDGFSYADPKWHARQFEDMRAAGIDVAMPVFWGVPGRHDDWNFKGLRAMVEALDGMKDPPKLALFYDTTTLDGVDLTKDAGSDQFVKTVRDFYSMIPPKHWALLDGRPIVWLYSSHWPKKKAPFDREGLAKALGREPLIVGDRGWGKVDLEYAWGAALGGAGVHGRVACVGPGYNDSAVPGRTTPIRDREKGAFYERGWYVALKSKPSIVAIETWNEFHEGTDVCESKEYGRAYIEATRKCVDLFKKGEALPAPKGKYSDAKSVTIGDGLRVVEHEDGLFDKTDAGYTTKKTKFGKTRYLYFDVDDSFYFWGSEELTMSVKYKGDAPVDLHYDAGTEPYKSVRLDGARGAGPDRQADVTLKDANFGNRQNSGADFRLAVAGEDITVLSVEVRRR